MADPKNPVQLLELVKALLEIYKLQKEVRSDGKIDLLDIPLVLGSGPKIWAGFMGIDKIDDELLVIDDEGRALVENAVRELDIPNDDVEVIIEDLFILITKMVEIGKRLQNILSKKDEE